MVLRKHSINRIENLEDNGNVAMSATNHHSVKRRQLNKLQRVS